MPIWSLQSPIWLMAIIFLCFLQVLTICLAPVCRLCWCHMFGQNWHAYKKRNDSDAHFHGRWASCWGIQHYLMVMTVISQSLLTRDICCWGIPYYSMVISRSLSTRGLCVCRLIHLIYFSFYLLLSAYIRISMEYYCWTCCVLSYHHHRVQLFYIY